MEKGKAPLSSILDMYCNHKRCDDSLSTRAFAKYKNDLEKKDNPDSAENAEGTAESTETNTPAAEPPIDPIAKKLSELSAQNGGMYSERKYRTSSGDQHDRGYRGDYGAFQK